MDRLRHIGTLAATWGLCRLATADPLSLPEAQHASVSVGDGERGELRGGVELPEDAIGVRRLTLVRERRTGFASRELIELLLRVGAELAEREDHAHVPIRVGNLSLAGGGEMRWSNSHRSGRDADLLLYLLDADEKPVQPDAFVLLDDDGNGRWQGRPVHLDAARTWRLVRLLLADAHAQVQHIHLAAPLIERLLAQARAIGEPEWLLQRAQVTLSEPTHAGRHDDHLHVRLFCSPADRLAGCQDNGPRHPWLAQADGSVRLEVARRLARLGALSGTERAAAVEALTWFQAADPRVPEALAWAASRDGEPEVREAARQALRKAGVAAAAPFLWQAAEQGAPEPLALLELATALATPEQAPNLLSALAPGCGTLQPFLGPSHCAQLQVAIAVTVRPWLLEPAAEPLHNLLRADDATVRRAALHSLETLANRRFHRVDDAELWWQRDGPLGRRHWLLSGMLLHNLPINAPLPILVPKLIALVDAPDAVLALNADAMLQELLAHGPRDLPPTIARKYRAWLRFWQTHETRYWLPAFADAAAVELPEAATR